MGDEEGRDETWLDDMDALGRDEGVRVGGDTDGGNRDTADVVNVDTEMDTVADKLVGITLGGGGRAIGLEDRGDDGGGELEVEGESPTSLRVREQSGECLSSLRNSQKKCTTCKPNNRREREKAARPCVHSGG